MSRKPLDHGPFAHDINSMPNPSWRREMLTYRRQALYFLDDLPDPTDAKAVREFRRRAIFNIDILITNMGSLAMDLADATPIPGDPRPPRPAAPPALRLVRK